MMDEALWSSCAASMPLLRSGKSHQHFQLEQDATLESLDMNSIYERTQI